MHNISIKKPRYFVRSLAKGLSLFKTLRHHINPNFVRVFEKPYHSSHYERQRSNLLVKGLLRRFAPRNDILRALRNSG